MNIEQELKTAVERFVAEQVSPRVEVLDAAGSPPDSLIKNLRELGLFGMAVPEEHGGLGLPYATCASLLEALARGWTTLAGYLNSHATVCYLIATHGTEEQKQMLLPVLADGAKRGALTLTEPHAGSDLKAIRTVARRNGDGYVLNGEKTYVTNGRKADVLMALVKTDPGAQPAQRGISLLIVRKDFPGVVTGSDFRKMAFGHVDTCEIRYDDARVPGANLLGGEEGRGMAQLLDGLELGRIMIAATAVGLSQAAIDAAVAYGRDRTTFGVSILEHQAIQLQLAEMATKCEAARQLTRAAAEEKQRAGRADMLSGMAKLFASEAGVEITTGVLRIHGGAGYIKGYAAERLYREAPLYVVGEGTNEIQKLVICRRLLERMDTGA